MSDAPSAQAVTPVAREDLGGTSIVFRQSGDGDPPPAGTGPALADRLARQVVTAGRPLAYLLSGAPITRRAARLLRNIEEQAVCARHASVRGMADATIAASWWPSPVRQGKLPWFGARA